MTNLNRNHHLHTLHLMQDLLHQKDRALLLHQNLRLKSLRHRNQRLQKDKTAIRQLKLRSKLHINLEYQQSQLLQKDKTVLEQHRHQSPMHTRLHSSKTLMLNCKTLTRSQISRFQKDGYVFGQRVKRGGISLIQRQIRVFGSQTN